MSESPAFTVAVTWSNTACKVAVEGDIDVDTAPGLAAVVQAMAASTPGGIVLDLGGVDFLGAAALGIIASTAAQLAPAGGRLTLRSPSRMAKRLLDICALTAEVDIDDAPEPSAASAAGAGHLGDEQPRSGPDAPVAATLARALGPQLRRVTAIPANDDVVDGALRLVVALTQAAVRSADGVSVSLNRHGRLATVAASDRTIAAMDADQYATGEGPCVDASVNGRWFHAEALGHDTRWPSFTPMALGLGINAILSTPLLAGGRPAGAINMYSRTEQAFAVHEQELAATFATHASRILTEAGVGFTDDEVSERLAESLRVRMVIAQAQGVLMNREGCSAEEAYTVIRRLSVAQSRPLAEVAADVIASPRHGARLEGVSAT